ncbi:MAG: L-rhamnose isomerase [Spirochaetaceae bacterium]|nr:MAG: L-rhamnose isomerase [Spirochaetaceae bacterium]
MGLYETAREQYAAVGVDTNRALALLAEIPVSVHCWQGDDVMGFEGATQLTGGILATGNYPGRARNVKELRADVETAFGLIPGRKRFNLHAMYLDHGGAPVDRDAIEPQHFASWIEWARGQGVALDFNPTFFSHAKSADGFTLAHRDAGIRDFWIEHGRRCRTVAAHIGRELGSACRDNFWIPDGWKDHPADRLEHRALLVDALDRIFAEKLDPAHTLDAVESKLFGIGSETYVVGSHEFYLAYALSRNVVLTLDAGHFHPTESVAEKISALLPFVPRLLLHVSRPVRWDSDHVVLFDDETRAIMREIARPNAWDRVDIALDFFDASINRIAAWVIGTRATMKAILAALLEPREQVLAAEREGRLADRLGLLEEAKLLPIGAVWDEFCRRSETPTGGDWMREVASYERAVLAKRT